MASVERTVGPMVWDINWRDSYGNDLPVDPESTNLELCYTPPSG